MGDDRIKEYQKKGKGDGKMKRIKRIGLIMMAVAMAFCGSLAIGETKAGATNTSVCFATNNATYGGEGCLYTRDDASNIYATYQNALNNYHYVTMTVQRFYSYAWHDIESKSGYAEYTWSKNQTFNPTFYGYSYKGQYVRIRVQLRSGWSGPSGAIVATAYSPSFLR
jgi:hypothetical protein